MGPSRAAVLVVLQCFSVVPGWVEPVEHGSQILPKPSTTQCLVSPHKALPRTVFLSSFFFLGGSDETNLTGAKRIDAKPHKYSAAKTTLSTTNDRPRRVIDDKNNLVVVTVAWYTTTCAAQEWLAQEWLALECFKIIY